MIVLARRLSRARHRLGERWATLVLVGLWPLLGLGLLSGPGLWRGELLPIAVVTMFALTLLLALVREVVPERGSALADPLAELELGLLFTTAVYVLVAATGGARSFLYPLVYALVSFLAIVHRHRGVLVGWLLAVVALEVLVGWPEIAAHGLGRAAQHLVFVGFFAAGNVLVLSGLVRRLRRDLDTRVDESVARLRQEARDFRLIAAQLPPQSRTRSRSDEELRMAVAAVGTIHEQLFHHVDLLRTALELHTCALLWCEAEGSGRHPRLVVKEMATIGDAVSERRVIDAPGILTTVLADPKPLRLHALGGRRVPPFYDGPVAVTDLCVVPLRDGPHLRGLLCADRTGDRPFDDDAERALEKAAAHILRVIEHERAFAAVERGKYEQEQFYRASELLGEGLTHADVCARTFAAVRLIAHYDLAVLTRLDDDGAGHRVLAVDVPAGEEPPPGWRAVAEALHERALPSEACLVAMAIKNRHHVPATGDLVDEQTVVFDARTRLPGLSSLLVLPLGRRDELVGTLVLASVRPRQYAANTREMLRVISRQVAVSLDNARMYEAMEERATTDGLTGLTNHRAFQERMAQLHALTERTAGKYAVILGDIDHFKSVNDTYGHPVGDQVLRKVAAILAGRSRRVDIVARYGGEEFCLVLPDTDGAGAEHFANELREEVARQSMSSEHGSFHVSMSMGVAEYPNDGSERAALIERADQALYWCKEHGRNRVRRALDGV